MSLMRTLLGQFRRPHGTLGHLAGWIMARRPSNRQRNLWTLDLLEVAPGHRVLEIGFGPGFAIEQLAERCPEARIVGIDHSAAMLAQATRRNRAAIRRGQVTLRCAPVEAPGSLDGPFDRVYSANVAQFWDDRGAVFRRIRAALAPGGRVVTTYLPRHRSASDDDALAFGRLVASEMHAAGFAEVELRQGARAPVLMVSIVGAVPAGG